MLIRLLKIIAHRRGALGCTSSIVILIAAIAITIGLLKCGSGPASELSAPADEADVTPPRLLLSRLWFDKLPEKPRDEIDLWIFFGGGIGIHETGSRYRASFDLFEFERQGALLDAKNLHDKKAWRTGFLVRDCKDHAPFNICLTLERVNGKKVDLYGFMYEDEMEAAIPGSKSTLASAKARAAK